MRISISNIAWDAAEDAAVARVLSAHGVEAIDVAPGKYFPDPESATARDIDAVRQAWQSRGVAVVGMQALLFGSTGLNVFGPPPVQEAMLRRLSAVCRIGAGLGAGHLVFGSPKNRDRTGLDDGQALRVAVDFFRRLGDEAARHGVQVCLEPNPPRYGANFMTTSAETAAVVEAVAHPAIRMQLDTGAMAINGEDAASTVAAFAHLVGHVHASEPDLLPLGDGTAPHDAVHAALVCHLPYHVVCIEMLATTGEPHLVSVGRAVARAVAAYRPAPGAPG
jgi:sugar phosphate isomerase/epimerase